MAKFHRRRLSPLLTTLARELYRRVGHFIYPAFEQWELELLRDAHPWRAVLLFEQICGVYEAYVSKHPEAANDNKILRSIVEAASGTAVLWQSDKEEARDREIKELLSAACNNRWKPLMESSIEWPAGTIMTLEYRDIIEELDLKQA